MAHLLDSENQVSVFELQSRYYIHYQTLESYDSLILPDMG